MSTNIVAMSLKSQALDLYAVEAELLSDYLNDEVLLFKEIDKMLEVQEVKDAMKIVLKEGSEIGIEYEVTEAEFLEHDWEDLSIMIKEAGIGKQTFKAEVSTVSPYLCEKIFLGCEVVEEEDMVFLKHNKDKKGGELILILVDRKDVSRKRILGVAKAGTPYNESITANSVQASPVELIIDYDDKGRKIDIKSYNKNIKDFNKKIINNGTWGVE